MRVRAAVEPVPDRWTFGVGAPTAPGQLGDLYLDTATGEAYEFRGVVAHRNLLTEAEASGEGGSFAPMMLAGATAAVTTERAAHGTHSLRMTNASTGYAQRNSAQPIPASASSPYTVLASVYADRPGICHLGAAWTNGTAWTFIWGAALALTSGWNHLRNNFTSAADTTGAVYLISPRDAAGAVTPARTYDIDRVGFFAGAAVQSANWALPSDYRPTGWVRLDTVPPLPRPAVGAVALVPPAHALDAVETTVRPYVTGTPATVLAGQVSSITPAPAALPDQFNVAWMGQIDRWQQSHPCVCGVAATNTMADRAWWVLAVSSASLIPATLRFGYIDVSLTGRTFDVAGYTFDHTVPHVMAMALDITGNLVREARAYTGDPAGLPDPEQVEWRHAHTAIASPAQQYEMLARTQQRVTVTNVIHSSAAWPSQWRGPLWWCELRSGLVPGQGDLLWRFDAAEHPGGMTSPWIDPRGRTWLMTAGQGGVVRGIRSHLVAVNAEVI